MTLPRKFYYRTPSKNGGITLKGVGKVYLQTAINAILAAAGYNFRLLLNWLRLLLCLIASLMLPRSKAAVRLQIA